jgi:hypothetical protein
MRRFAYAAVVCAGAPVLALGFGATPAAWAAPGDHGASVSINGDVKHQGSGTAISDPSSSTGAPNIAVAVNGSGAFAVGGPGNRAIAVNGSTAQAGGTDNSATAINNSGADAVGTGNTALATCSGGPSNAAFAFGTGTTTTIHGSHGPCPR